MKGKDHYTPDQQAREGVNPSFTFDELESIFLNFSTALLKKNTEEEVLWELAKNCISQLNFVDCVIYLTDPERKVLVQKAAYGPKNPEKECILNALEIPLGQGITGSVAVSGQAEVIKDTTLDKRYIVDDVHRLSEIAVPIKLNEVILGVIDCEHPKRDFFTAQHLRILTAIASICAIKLSSIQVERLARLEQQRVFDIQKQLEDLKAQALKAQINPHFLFNALNAIQYFLTRNDQKSALSYLSLFSKLLRYRLANYRNEAALLNNEIEVLEWYLKLQELRYTEKFKFKIEKPPTHIGIAIKIPSMVIPFLLESAVERSIFDQTAGTMSLIIKVIKPSVYLHLKHHMLEAKITRPESERWESFQQTIKPWQEQIEKLNAIMSYQITEKTEIITDAEGSMTGLEIKLHIPILE